MQVTFHLMDVRQTFQSIRDLPYHIPLSPDEPDYCCNGKVRMLKQALDAAGYTTRYRVCDFVWSDLPLDPEVLAIPHDNQSTHVYLEVRHGKDWLNVDPTWDAGLHMIFPTTVWDGTTSTSIAVTPLHLYSDTESLQIMEHEDDGAAANDIRNNRAFYAALNAWLQTVRSKTCT